MPVASPETLTDAEKATVREVIAGGGTAEDAARAIRRRADKVRKFLREGFTAGHTEPPARVATAPAMPPVVMSAEVADMRRAAVETAGDFDEPVEELWRKAEELSARKIRKAAEQSTFRFRAPGPHVLIAAVSDQHIAPGTPVDFKAMREDAELIRDTPNCYAVLGGDGTDNHIKHRAAILAQRSTPEDQFRLYEYYLQILVEKLITLISGNHCNWTVQFAGVDMVARIAHAQKICYAPDEAIIEVSVGSQTYTIGMRHQFRMNSSFNQTHSVKQWLRLGEREFDLGIVGHHHEHAMESFVYRQQLRWGCRPGSYQITSAYSRAYGYNKSIPTTPTFLLRGDRKEILGFPTLRAAREFIGAAREIGVGG